MAAIIHQTDKRSGITYAYESVSYWDKKKKQSRAKRRLIGRVDPVTKEIVPTDGRGRKDKHVEPEVVKRGPSPSLTYARCFYGATYLLDAIGNQIGLIDDIKQCFPERYRQILSVAYYLILEEYGSMQRFEKWSMLHKHPHGASISSQRGSELFASINEESRQRFFALHGRRKEDSEFWAYDTTTISSYSKQLRQICQGYNKEHDLLSQLNLAVIFGAESSLPFYYRKLPGNMPDVKTVRHLLGDLDQLGFSKVKLVMDRGFYSEANVNALYGDHRKFLLSAKMSISFVCKELEPIYDSFRSFEHYDTNYELYTRTVSTTWEYQQPRPYKGDILKQNRRLYIHYYFNIERAAEEEKGFDRRLIQWREELLQDKRVKAHESLYDKYFIVTQTPKGGIKVEIKKEAVVKVKRYYGYFTLITNQKMDSIKALQIYRNKDVVEKAFGNLKERLNMRRLLVSSEQSLDGKLFIAFVALILLSYIKKQMQDHKLFKTYTLGTLLDQLDVIECFEVPGKKMRVGEILQKQKAIYEAMGVKSPDSL